MPERLIGGPPLVAHSAQLVSVVGLIVRQSTLKRTPHPLVIVRHLLSPEEPTTTMLLIPLGLTVIPLDPIAPPTAAARAEQPEQPRRHRKHDAQPSGHIDILPQRAMDVILIQRGIERPIERRIQNRRRERKRQDEQTRHRAHDRREQAAQATEQREEAHEDFEDGGDESDDVRDEHPLRHRLVRVQPGFQLFAEELVHARVVQLPHVHGVEPEFVGVRGAIRHVIAPAIAARFVGDEGALAVVPERDVVEIPDPQCRLDDPLGGVEEGGGVNARDGGQVGDVGGGDVDVGGVGPEEVEVVVAVVVFVGPAQPDDDQADERADGEGHGSEDAGEAAGFAHGGGDGTVVGGSCVCRRMLVFQRKGEKRG